MKDTIRNILAFSVVVLVLLYSAWDSYGSEIYMDNHNSCVDCHGRFPEPYGKILKKGEVVPIPEHKVDILCMGCHNPVGIAKLKTPTGGGTNPIPEIIGYFVDSTGFHWKNIVLYIDTNNNGKYDEGEPTAPTDENGSFKFSGIADEGYPIRPIEGMILSGYVINTIVQDGIVSIISTAKQATIKGTVWTDINRNVKFDSADGILENIIVFIDTNKNGLYNVGEPVTLTGADGSYTLIGVSPTPVDVRCEDASAPVGYDFIGYNNPVTVIPNPDEIVTDVNFGFTTPLAVTSSLGYPTRLAVTDNEYIITDPRTNSVFMYDYTGKPTGHIKKLSKPLGIDTDELGNIYIGSEDGKCIDIYDSNGNWKGVWGLSIVDKPTDILYNDGLLYVLDSKKGHVRVFKNGQSIRVIGEGKFEYPIAMAIRGNGLYVADKATHYISVFDLQGNHYYDFGGPVDTVGGRMGMPTRLVWEGLFAGIQSIAVDKYGMLHVLDSYLDKVQILTNTGTYLGYYDAFIPVFGVDARLQMDIDIAPNGDVYMTNVTSRKVEKIYEVK